MNNTKFIAAAIVLCLIGMPTISFAKARGGSGGGFSSGSRSGGSSGSMGSRGSRTHQDNGAKPIEQSTTAKPATTPPPSTSTSPTAQPAPAAQPSWLQRNPLLAGIAGGIAGSWLGHMIFGATDSSARTTENGERGAEGAQTAGASGPNWMLILLMVMGVGGLYYYFKGRRTPAPDFSGISRSTAVSGSLLAESSAAPTLRTATIDSEITRADKTAFQQSLIEIQTAWSKQDISGLRRLVTPEMLEYFSTGLAEQASQELANHVEQVELQQADVRESWVENTAQYATVNLTWTAHDYTVSTTKQPGEAGYLIEGNKETPSETTEVWTFMRYQHGKWLLSAIQQIA